MRVMVMIKANKESEAGVMPDEKFLGEMMKYNEELVSQGIMLAGEGLHPSSNGARVKFSDGKATVVDGPFAETKELVGGYAIFDLKSKEEAVANGRQFMQLHADILGASYEGELEIRPMFDGPPPSQ